MMPFATRRHRDNLTDHAIRYARKLRGLTDTELRDLEPFIPQDAWMIGCERLRRCTHDVHVEQRDGFTLVCPSCGPLLSHSLEDVVRRMGESSGRFVGAM